MDFALAKRLVDISADIGIKHTTLIGGEPTLYDNMFELCQYCRSKKIEAGIVTNACKFGDDHYWQRFLQNPLDGIGISIKGMTEKQFLDVVGSKQLYDQTMKGIERILHYYPNMGVSVVFSNLTTPDDILNIATQAKSMGAKSFQISGCSTVFDHHNGPKDDCMLGTKHFVEGLMRVYDPLMQLYDGEISIEARLPLCVFPQKFINQTISDHTLQNICHVQNRSGLVFDTDGMLLPCNSMIGIDIGKINRDFSNGQELLDYLNTNQMQKDYQELLRYPSDECAKCDFNDICRGGCLMNWTVLTPDVCHAVKK